MTDIRPELSQCTLCADRFAATATGHRPNPVVWFQPGARLLIASQAPGLKVHEANTPFWDASGKRLRDWLGAAPNVHGRALVVSLHACALHALTAEMAVKALQELTRLQPHSSTVLAAQRTLTAAAQPTVALLRAGEYLPTGLPLERALAAANLEREPRFHAVQQAGSAGGVKRQRREQ